MRPHVNVHAASSPSADNHPRCSKRTFVPSLTGMRPDDGRRLPLRWTSDTRPGQRAGPINARDLEAELCLSVRPEREDSDRARLGLILSLVGPEGPVSLRAVDGVEDDLG
jgi:hypothetical protein